MADKNKAKRNNSIIKHNGRHLCRYWANLPNGTRKRAGFYTDTKQEATEKLYKQAANQDKKYQFIRQLVKQAKEEEQLYGY